MCLNQYFDLLAAAPDADLSAPVRTIFAAHTPPGRRVRLLHVLASVSEKHPAPALLSTTRDIAYEVVSTEAAAGNLAPLSLLRHFVPDDRLLSADCSRFATQPPPAAHPPAAARPAASLAAPGARCHHSVVHRHRAPSAVGGPGYPRQPPAPGARQLVRPD